VGPSPPPYLIKVAIIGFPLRNSTQIQCFSVHLQEIGMLVSSYTWKERRIMMVADDPPQNRSHRHGRIFLRQNVLLLGGCMPQR
jgi:hypothetical protein